MKSDIEINHEVMPYPIEKIASYLGIDSDSLECYGKDKAKINSKGPEKEMTGKLILVTSINPTPYGEGKTTVSIGLQDALCALGEKSVAALREPSLGPVFGIKGGATGGGYAQMMPMEDINLHFTGDIHAVTTCNNLLCAIVDNHIFQGNLLQLDIDEIYIRRCLDINDRALREVTLQNGRVDRFQITTASEIMAILCLCQDIEDLRFRLGNILIGKNLQGKPVFAKDLQCVDALLITLKDAFKPNLVQTLEHNPVLIHGGPFANIAHGCSSVIATKLGLQLADYVVTEAGFGADLGALKFFDIKGRVLQKFPDAVVVNVTVRAILHHGNGNIKEGLENVKVHLENISQYTSKIVVTINRFLEDTEENIEEIIRYVHDLGYICTVCTAYQEGGKGALALAKEVIELCKQETQKVELYNINDSISSKIETICTKIYRADHVTYSESAISKIKWLEENKLYKVPICIAKTQYSLSDDAKKIGYPKQFTMHVTDTSISCGAGFIIVYMGNIMTMPGLSKEPAYLTMKMNQDGSIDGMY